MAWELSSALAGKIAGYADAMRAMGRRCDTEMVRLRELDRLACEMGWESEALGRELVEAYVTPRPWESPRTVHGRRSTVRCLGRWLLRHGDEAYVLPVGGGPRIAPYTPVVMSEDEVRRLIAAADAMPENSRSPLRHLVFPALFRTIYACGMRVTEARTLSVGDVDLAAGTVTIRPENAKLRKGRVLPMSAALTGRLDEYVGRLGVRGPSAPLFPSPRGIYAQQTVGRTFRGLLAAAGIPHTDAGPTVHSLRHSFACHRIMHWAREGKDVDALLPILSAYLGHEGITCTEIYLRLTAEMMPDLRDAIEDRLSWVIPGGDDDE